MPTNNTDSLHPDLRSLLTWIVSGAILYLLISGALVYWLPFSVYTQYSVIIHTITGVVSLLPTGWIVWLHWQRRATDVIGSIAMLARATLICLVISLASGLLIAVQAGYGTEVQRIWRLVHQVFALALGITMFAHLLPILSRYGTTPSTPRRLARRWFIAAAAVVIVVPLTVTQWVGSSDSAIAKFQAFPDNYDWRFGVDRPFWPSRAQARGAPWEIELRNAIEGSVSGDERVQLLSALSHLDGSDSGPISRLRNTLADMSLAGDVRAGLDHMLESAEASIKANGAIRPEALLGSESCGSSGCHDTIYKEWTPSAHGFAATDVLFRDVQEALADHRSSADTRACAGCHDAVALLGGERDGGSIKGDDLVIHEGNSCIVCHSIVETSVQGNGSFVIEIPDHYLFSDNPASGSFWNRFLIRSYPNHHITTYSRPLYSQSEYCAACHKQTSAQGTDTDIGIAQEQNEYDSWLGGHWYREDEPDKRLGCRDCHMPLVAGDDPGSGGTHRSHRTLGSNMYIPVAQSIPGGEEQAEQTIAWLRGEIEIPEIADRWVDGPVVAMTIVAPDKIEPGELINLALVLHNNKTGHDFPAGPLDILASWVELRVEDNLGRTLLHLGDPSGDKPTLDAPIVYKADWYDKRGLPVERHDIWDVVGSSYKRSLASGDAEIVEIPFRCPAIARPKISGSYSETGPGERKSDVVFSIDNEAVTELTVSARLLYRKADPEFIEKTYGLDSELDVPIVELNSSSHKIRVEAKR